MTLTIALFLALQLGACSGFPLAGSMGCPLPGGSPAWTEVRVQIVPRRELQSRAKSTGATVHPWLSVHGMAEWTPDNRACVVTLADDQDGFAALEHELWHCKRGAWLP
ncbi:MAG: hypothetical protein FJ271_31495 [Planctomycetes bacterium]|nr:hypothetical protein [Planctomycetota bacterium]